MNSIGKPDAANPHVRFDERGRETEPLAQRLNATAPFLDSTIPVRHADAQARFEAPQRRLRLAANCDRGQREAEGGGNLGGKKEISSCHCNSTVFP
jgi:hypothetical protein